MPDDYVTLPTGIPVLEYLTNEELSQLRTKLSIVSRDARRKASIVIQRYPSLKRLWTLSLSVDNNTSQEDRDTIHRSFEQELLKNPEAYLAHAWANSLVILNSACGNEMLRRTGPRKKGDKTPQIPPPPPVPTFLTPDERQASMEALFEQARKEDSI
jgi:hypothetical protein